MTRREAHTVIPKLKNILPLVYVPATMRGSPYVHSFWWIEGAPNVDTVEGRQQAPEFIDQHIISTVLPDPAEDPELHRLVSTLQMHRHSPTCYKNNRVTCRFNYPRPRTIVPCDATRLRTNTDPGSSNFLNMAQQIRDGIVRIRLQDSFTPLDIAAQVAPNLTSLEGTMSDFHDHSEQVKVKCIYASHSLFTN